MGDKTKLAMFERDISPSLFSQQTESLYLLLELLQKAPEPVIAVCSSSMLQTWQASKCLKVRCGAWHCRINHLNQYRIHIPPGGGWFASALDMALWWSPCWRSVWSAHHINGLSRLRITALHEVYLLHLKGRTFEHSNHLLLKLTSRGNKPSSWREL